MLTELVEISREWSFLALALGLKQHVIAEIETDYPSNVSKCREKMVVKWFELQPSQLSWSSLCTALRTRLVDRPDIAKKIERKYPASGR